MPPTNQPDDSQFDTVQHPVLGPLKFPKDMDFDERNASIQYALSKRQASTGVSAQAPSPTLSPVAPPLKGPMPQPESGMWDKLASVLPDSPAMWKAASTVGDVLTLPERKIIQPASEYLDAQKADTMQKVSATGHPMTAALMTFESGATSDLAKMAVSTVADPKNWPFLMSGGAGSEVRPALRVASDALFTGLQSSGALDALKEGRYSDAAIQAGFATLGLAHLPGEVKTQMLDHAKARATGAPIAPPVPGAQMDLPLDASAHAPQPPVEVTPLPPSPKGIVHKAGEVTAKVVPPAQEESKAIPIEIAPEPVHDTELSSLLPEHKQAADNMVEALVSGKATAELRPEEEPLRRTVEEAGGKYKGVDPTTQTVVHTAPPEAVGGRTGVPIETPVERVTPENIRTEVASKAADLVPADTTETPAVSHELPQSLLNSFKNLVQLKRDLDKGGTPEQIASITQTRDQEVSRARSLLRNHLQQLSLDDLSVLKGEVSAAGDFHADRASQIRDSISQHEKNLANYQEAVKMRQVGFTEVVGKAGQELIEKMGGEAAVTRQAETQPLSRSILAKLTGKIPQYTIEDLIPRKRPEAVTEEAWDGLMSKIKNKLQADHDSVLRDAQIAQHMHEESGATGDWKLEDTDIPARLKQIDADARMYGKFPPTKVGRRPLAPVVDEKGEIRPMAPMEIMSKERASRLIGVKKIEKIPSPEEFKQHADDREELARLHKAVLPAIDKAIELKTPLVREGERGAVGMAPTVTPPIDPKIFEGKNALALAKKAKLRAYDVTVDKPADYQGWLSPDGKQFIDKGMLDHFEVSKVLFPEAEATGSAERAMQDAGWIRKANHGEYEVRALTSKSLDTIAMDMNRNGRLGKPLIIDYHVQYPRPHYEDIDIRTPWTDLERTPEVRQALANVSRGPEAGISGTEILGGGTIGATAGAAIGGAVAGPPGAIIGGATGWTLGAISPALIRSKFVADSFARVRPLTDALHITPSEWFRGPTETPAISPRMEDIRNAQKRSLRAPEANLAQRISMIPGDAWHALDPYAFLQDRPSLLQRWTMQADPRGQYFRDTQGKLAVDESPYVAARQAVEGMRGSVDVARHMYAAIERDAHRAGLHEDTTAYLNLKGYAREYQVMQEHGQELIASLKSDQNSLAGTDLSVRDRMAIEDRIKDTRGELTDMVKNLRDGKIVPKNYTPDLIKQDLGALQEKLGPEKFNQVESLAKRVFDVNRKSLDLIADAAHDGANGLIAPEAYQRYVARGNEYIPMRRIRDEVLANKYGMTLPLWLKKQKVVLGMEGSELINKDPWQASADAHAEVIRETFRNQTLNTVLDSAKANPDIEEYFRSVKPDYKAATGEITVGSYRNGKVQNYAVPEWLGKTLDNTSPIQAQSVLGAVTRATNRLFKGLATVASPSWLVGKQLPTMAFRELLTMEGPLAPGKIREAFATAARAAWTHDENFQEYAKTGLARQSLMRQFYPEQGLSPQEMGFKLANPIRIVDSIASLSNFVTDTMTMNHWLRLRQAGLSPVEATARTREFGPLPDYSQMGRADGVIGTATMFIRADWAHIRSTLALATEKQYRGRLALAATAFAMSSLALANHNMQQVDDKGNPLWARISDSDKERYWVILRGGINPKDGRPNVVKIPKPDVVRILFNPMEDAMYFGLGKSLKNNADNRTLGQHIANTVSRFIPTGPQFDASQMTTPTEAIGEVGKKMALSGFSQLNPALRVPTEETFGKTVSFGQVRPIVTQPRISPEMQGFGAAGVSPTSMEIGRQTGISPQRLEHMARGFLGPGAQLAESITDPFTRSAHVLTQGTQGARRTPVTGGIVSQFTEASPMDQQVSDLTKHFYTGADKVIAPLTTFNMLMKENPQVATRFFHAHKNEIASGQLAMEMQSSIKQLGDAEMRVKQNPNLTPERRVQILENLRGAKVKLLTTFNRILDRPQPMGVGGESPMGSPAR